MTETRRAFPILARSCLVGGAIAASLMLAAWTSWANGKPRVVDKAPPVAAVPAEGARAAPAAPAALQARLDGLAASFGSPVGMAVTDVQRGWTASVDGDRMFPQQSVSKLWVAISVLDAVDRGEAGLDDSVVMRPDDVSVFYQPIARKIRPEGYRVTLRQLLGAALIESDNAANDKLMRQVGDAEGVATVMRRKGLAHLKVGASERDLQSMIAGLTWDPAYGRGRTFQAVRETLPESVRDRALKAYLDDPADGAAPAAITHALAALQRREVLSPASTAVMLDLMAQATTGPKRLRGGLPEGWRIAHKTGTGQDWRGSTIGVNDVGLLTAPDGRSFAVAVMIRRTARPVPERMVLMQQAARAVVDVWEAEQPRPPPSAVIETVKAGD